jgi:glycosyltransferase involved in cell wall biosynthesis
LRSLTFAVPGGLALATGGAIYDRKVIDGLRSAGWQVEVLHWPDSFPFPDNESRHVAAESLAGLPDGTPVVIDGLALGTLPALACEHAARLRLVALVHHPLAMETGLPAEVAARFAADEREALRSVRAVIVTSETTAATLARDYAVPRERIAVAPPGLERPSLAPIRKQAGPPRILSVGAVSPRKAHHLLVEALAAIGEFEFSCRIVGSLDRFPETAAALADQIEKSGLAERVCLTGEVSEAQLARFHAEADLFALASLYEGYGMALAEAMAWGLPVIATTGGAIPEVVPDTAGLLVPPGDAAALAGALRRVLTDANLREKLGDGAREAATELGGWDLCAARFAQALERVAKS